MQERVASPRTDRQAGRSWHGGPGARDRLAGLGWVQGVVWCGTVWFGSRRGGERSVLFSLQDSAIKSKVLNQLLTVGDLPEVTLVFEDGDLHVQPEGLL